MSTASEPYLSIVVAARNDNHGDSLIRRMRIFLSHLLEQCRVHRLSAELLLVEWNPPSDRAPLAKALEGLAGPSDIPVRIVTVPPAIHARFKHSAALPLFQMLAKNVGLRHASGHFVLCTNIDILFNDELARFLAARQLDPGAVYRIDRWDVDERTPLQVSAPERLAYCRRHLVRVASRQGTLPLDSNGLQRILPNDIVPPDAGLNLGLGWFPLAGQHGNLPSRWLASGAEFSATPTEPRAGVALLLEPGLQVRGPYAEIELLSADGMSLAQGCLFGRHWLHFGLPLTPGHKHRFHIRIDNAGIPDPATGELRDARVFKLEWSPLPQIGRPTEHSFRRFPFLNCLPDIDTRAAAPMPDGVHFGARWHPWESRDSFFSRWADDGAELHFDSVDASGVTLQLETGPGVGYLPFTLELRDAEGVLVAEAEIAGSLSRRKRHLKNLARREASGGAEQPKPRAAGRARMLKRVLRYFKHTLFPPFGTYTFQWPPSAGLQRTRCESANTCLASALHPAAASASTVWTCWLFPPLWRLR